MADEYYEKQVVGHWYSPQLKKTIEVYAITYEMTRQPDRENVLTMELLADFQGAGDFDYIDDEKIKHEDGLPIYPVIEIGSVNTREIFSENQD